MKKKVRIVFAAIAVMAVVGGTVAFKAKSTINLTQFYTGPGVNNCTTPVQATTTNAGGELVFAGTTKNSCPTQIRITTVEP